MLDLIQAVSDGILFGATYALIGIGFTLVFGVMHKINMSYAAASIGGAYLGHWLDGLNEGYSTRWSVNLILLGLALGIFNVIVFVRKYW